MDYPIFQMPAIGGSLLIAAVAIVHVVIAHFAVGAGLFMAVTEWRANRRHDQVLLEFLRRHSKFLVLFSFVAGALTGVGIWFTIALVSPRATSNLIHLFVWAWATEWVFFVVEIASGYIYYYTWGRLSPGRHNVVGWVYAISAAASLVLINGIISFMLTPGRFAGPADFWHNLFNPSFWPSVFVRLISSMALASIFVMIVVNYASGFTREQRHAVIRSASRWLLPLVLMLPLAWWYFRVVPEPSRQFIFGQSSIAMGLLFVFGAGMSLLIGCYAYFGLLRAGRYINGESALMLLAIAFVATGSMEFVREGIRKPWVIREQLYSTQLTPEELTRCERDGTLELSRWHRRTGEPVRDGRSIFLIQCYACHTTDGAYNPIAPMVANWTKKQYDSNLENLHATRDSMPHYEPTRQDRDDLVAYLRTLRRDKSGTGD